MGLGEPFPLWGVSGTTIRGPMVLLTLSHLYVINETISHGFCSLNLIHMNENEHQLYSWVGYGADYHIRRA